MKRIILAALVALSINFVNAQTKKPVTKTPAKSTTVKVGTGPKIGYIFEDYIFENYKEVKKLDEDIKKKQDTYQETYNKMAIEYQTLYLDYQNSMKNLDSMTTERLNEKLRKVQEVKSASENFQREAEKELQQFTGDGVVRIKTSIKTTAETIAKEKGFKYIFTRNKSDGPMTSNRVVLYAGDKGAGNISDAVLARMGSPVVVKK
ncbi:OmpH family outer membrane protein [Lacihabitans sp. CS3-21]|jgi:outer membrane protein|uniref:OmpH family outer membrane protein n=1 Tax=Lacihabitans sp. CS3-21 TaxID=2487332 RepID=UPI0020CC4160|nr:OmpH family outer membrane protein [Lacihabitans sp. CS3-21]MCP9745522.1 OmpH family outer membrane protein [Lacihabitans sp. CS3-21]